MSHEQIFDDNRCKREKEKKNGTIDCISGRVKHP
jgi:hypothetical protein